MSTLQTLIQKYKEGKIAPHKYVSDGASRDPECDVKGCKWYWDKHIHDPRLLEMIKEESN